MIALSNLEWGYCAVVLVASYALRGSTGFGGFAAMPLLALVIPMKVLVPVWTLLTISSSATLFGKDRKHVSFPMILRILPSCTMNASSAPPKFANGRCAVCTDVCAPSVA
jgi:hypothetical protein